AARRVLGAARRGADRAAGDERMIRSHAATAAAVWALSCAVSCGEEGRPPPSDGTEPAELAELGGETAARVGGEPISLALVQEVADAQRVSPREALRRLIDDAIAAHAARERGLERGVRWHLT